MSNNKIPAVLNEKPEPKLELRMFHKTKMPGWSGYVKIDKISGWAENRRIELFRRKCEAQFGRLPTDDEIYNFMLSEPELYIRELARSILNNGVRVPIILDANGTLLDGNRRYVATRHAIEHNPSTRDELANIPAWVLTEDTTSEHKYKVLVECNFISDWKQEWPPYIRAMTVYEEYTDNGMKMDQIQERYAPLKRGELRTMINVMYLIQEFLNFHSHSDEAFRIAYEHYHWFEEALNKLRTKLDSDPDLKEQFFAWMMENKFRNMKQVGRLGEIRDNEEAWAIIRSDSPDAVEAAIHIVQGEKLPSILDGEKKIKRLVKQLEGLTEREIASIGPGTLGDLEIILAQIIAMARAARQVKKVESNESRHRATSG